MMRMMRMMQMVRMIPAGVAARSSRTAQELLLPLLQVVRGQRVSAFLSPKEQLLQADETMRTRTATELGCPSEPGKPLLILLAQSLQHTLRRRVLPRLALNALAADAFCSRNLRQRT